MTIVEKQWVFAIVFIFTDGGPAEARPIKTGTEEECKAAENAMANDEFTYDGVRPLEGAEMQVMRVEQFLNVYPDRFEELTLQ